MKTQNTAVTLFKGGAVITMDAAVPNIATGDVLVEGTRIAQLGANIQADGAEVIDASGSIVMPGLIDAHHHMWLGVARRMMPNVDDLAAYFELIGRKMGLKYRPLDMHLSTKLTALASLDAGITSIIDACHLSISPEHTDAALDALAEAGISRVPHQVSSQLCSAAISPWACRSRSFPCSFMTSLGSAPWLSDWSSGPSSWLRCSLVDMRVG